jgi:hypothetical protein
MKGSNTMEFNSATMEQIVQHYFDTVLFKEGQVPKVTSVMGKTEMGVSSFTVRTSEKEEEK